MSTSEASVAVPRLLISRDAAVKSILLLGSLLATAAVVAGCGLTFHSEDLIRPLVFATFLSGLGLWYLRRQEPGFAMCLAALTQLVLFTSVYTVLMYAVAAINRPLVDSVLLSFDQLLGIRIDRVQSWARGLPAVSIPLALAYDSVMIQTALTVAVLGFRQQRRELEGFVLGFMLTTLACAACFVVLPAEGPFVSYGYEPNAAQQRYLNDLHAMRSGLRTQVTWQNAEGLITCPSFHTTWAVLLAWAFRRNRRLRWPMLVLNAAVILATMTTGWHYFADVLAGLLLAAVGIGLVHVLQKRLYDESGQPCLVRLA